MAPSLLAAALMDLNQAPLRRKMIQRSFRIFEDQLDSLRWLAAHKYRGRVNVSDLLRDFLDKGIEPEINSTPGHLRT
jgi:hypothetical protein